MAKKTMSVRLFCTLDNGSEQWGPGDCPTLPEDEALDLIKMGLAEKVEALKKARSAKPVKEQQPSGAQPESGQSSADESGKTEDQQPQGQADPGENDGEQSAPEAEAGGENNG